MRLATFNCNNLMSRYKFDKEKDNEKKEEYNGFTDKSNFYLLNETEKELTAEAINAIKADIIALEEVENLKVLDYFNKTYLNSAYTYSVLIDSHDPRRIDVAVLSKYPILNVKTHKDEKNTAKEWIFSRDCLEVEIKVDGKKLLLYVNHFKSMYDQKAKNSKEARENTKHKRLEQAKRVAEIVDEKWKSKEYKGNYVVLGDLNDYPSPDTSLGALLNHPGLVNIIERLPEKDRWTQFYSEEKEYKQLDYLLLSKSLAKLNTKKPGLMRKGLPLNAKKFTGKRFEGVGKEKPKASDHCPFYIDLKLE